MSNETKFNLDITIYDVHTLENVKLKLRAEFGVDPNQYGNGTSLLIKGRENCKFSPQLFDLRYEQGIIPYEVFLAKWVYNNWTGENGSYAVARLKIDKVDALRVC